MNGYTSTHLLFMRTFLPPLQCIFSETVVRTHGIPLGVNSGSHVVSDISIYCFNYVSCNQLTRPSKGHVSIKNEFVMGISSDFSCVCEHNSIKPA